MRFAVFVSAFVMIIVAMILSLLYPKTSTLKPVFAVTAPCPAQSLFPRVIGGLISTLDISGSDNKFSNPTGTCVIDPQAPFNPYKIPTYADLKSIYFTQSKATKNENTNPNPPAITSIANNTLYNYTNTGVSTGALSYLANTAPAVIFVDNDLSINNNITGSTTGGLVIVVGGDIKIATTVARIDAVLIAGGKIYTAGGAAGCSLSSPILTPNQLIINGSLISLDSNKTIEFCRTLGAGNNTTPAELINNQPKYLVILRNLFSDTLQKWSEIQ